MKLKNNIIKILPTSISSRQRIAVRAVSAFAIVTGMALSFGSCAKEEEKALERVGTPTKTFPKQEEDVELMNTVIRQYSKVIPVALENAGFRDVIKQAALLQFDGDYDVLVNDLHDYTLPHSDVSVFDFLATIVDDRFSEEFGMGGDSFLDEVVSVIPNLQVAVPVHIEKWNPHTYKPYVIPLLWDFEDGKDYMVEGYDVDLTTIHVSSKEEPDFPLIVVGVSERVDRDGHLSVGLNGLPKKIKGVEPPSPSHLYCEYTTAANAVRLRWPLVPGATGYAVYQTDDLGDDVLIGTTSGTENIFNSTGLETNRTYQYMVRSIGDDGESPYTNVAEITATDRRSGDPLRLKSFQFTEERLYAVESYLKGAPEIQLRVIKSNGTGDGTEVLYDVRFDPSRRSDVTSSPYICNEVLFSSWTQCRYNDVLIFEWREIDNCFPDEVTIKASYTIDSLRTFFGKLDVTASTMFKVSTNSHIARHNVCYWDPKSYSYGSIEGSGFTFAMDANLNN